MKITDYVTYPTRDRGWIDVFRFFFFFSGEGGRKAVNLPIGEAYVLQQCAGTDGWMNCTIY